MRICHIIETSGGGSGQIALDLLTCSLAVSDDITLIYSPVRAEPRFVESLGRLRGNIRIITLPMRRAVGMHDALAVWRLYRILRRLGPFDVIHSHSSKAGAVARLAGILLPRSVQVYTPHAFISMAPDASPLYGWIEWALSWLGDAIICVSEQEKRHARERLHIAERKLFVVPNGVQLNYPADRNHARRRLGFSDKAYIVGFVGRLVPQKNPVRLVRAFAAAAAGHPDLCLAIIGEGPLLADVEKELSCAGLRDRARILSGTNARDIMPGFDCLMCSSDYESFNLVLLEALTAGVPVVTTRVGIAEETLISGETGFIAADFSAEALSACLLKLIAFTPAEREKAIAGMRKNSQDFSIQKMFDRTLAVYNMMLNKRHKE